MNFDFAALLVFLTLASGLIWAVDALFFAPRRKREMDAGSAEAGGKEPVWVEYARSFFPIFLIVLILRSFIVEPFRIPSASMMPTLLIGDFILVNKYDYGIRLPVLHTRIVKNGQPARGDIVVFRYPEDPSIPYIKRVIGLPGDQISYRDRVLYVNKIPVKQELIGIYDGQGAGDMMDGAQLLSEQLPHVAHDILIDAGRFSIDDQVIVPAGHYYVMGDNRDNSKDSRFWGFVPEENLMGRAFLIWMNWDAKNGGIDWQRIGTILN